MPRTKTPKAQAADPNGSPTEGEVLTLAEAAAYLRVTEAEVLEAVQSQDLPGAQIGASWRFLKPALREWLWTGGRRGKTSKEAQRAVIGMWEGDPYWEEELREIYKRRGRPMTEE